MFLNHRRRTMRSAAAAIAGLALVAGCTSGGTKASSSKSEITIFNGASGQIAINFNPYSTTGSQLQPSYGIIYEPLFYYDNYTGAAPEPWLGTEYSWNSDNTKLTIKTRQGVKWTDGQAFSAKDVVFTFNMVLKNKAINSTGFNGTPALVDDNTLTITWPQPSFFEAANVLGRAFIVPEHIWKDLNPASTVNEKPVGTGAYMLDQFTSQFYTLKKNPDYYVKGKPEPDTLRYISLADNNAALAALKAGQVDWMSAFIPDIANQLSTNKDLTWTNTPQNQAALFTCSNAALGCKGPQTDVAVRKAIYTGIDRDQLNALAFDKQNGPVSPTFGLLPRDEKWISSNVEKQAPSTADATKAEKFLTDAGYAKGSDGIYAKDGQRVSMTVQVVTGWTDFIDAVNAMSQQLKAIGIELVPSQVSWQEWTDAKSQGNFELSMDSIGQQAGPDLYYIYNYYYTTANTVPVGQAANPNYARFSDATVDAAVNTLRSTSDPEKQKSLYGEIQKVIVDQLPYIPVLTNSCLTEFNTAHATGWPTKDNVYAFPATWSNPDAGQILRKITVKK